MRRVSSRDKYLEPVRCGFCDAAYHTGHACCGFNLRNYKDVFAQGKVMFICPKCRTELNGRCICTFLAEEKQQIVSPTASGDNVNTQIQQLTDAVAVLSKKVDRIVLTAKTPNSRDVWTPTWPELGSKRRRGEDGKSLRPAVDRGTSDTNPIDFNDLSVPFITPPVPEPKFWLYLSGFQPQIGNDDVQKIVACCLNTSGTFVWFQRIKTPPI